eukprot:1440748-Rhodomonas_salina.2
MHRRCTLGEEAGTDGASGTTRPAREPYSVGARATAVGVRVQKSATCLRTRSEMPGTDVEYGLRARWVLRTGMAYAPVGTGVGGYGLRTRSTEDESVPGGICYGRAQGGGSL